MADHIPLGKPTSYTDTYDSSLLFPVPRKEGREDLGLSGELPFSGEDIWNAYEISWLTPSGKPEVATAEIRVPAVSPNLVESKSLKLYLNSLNGTMYQNMADVESVIQNDLSKVAGVTVTVNILGPSHPQKSADVPVQGECIDNLDVSVSSSDVSANLLSVNTVGVNIEETLYTHLFRSLCPITGQPDWATVSIQYAGNRIDQAALLTYLISYRSHNEFHEHCVERIFMDILNRCEPEKLSVYARYTRRGGIDINPYRSNFPSTPDNVPAWRQ